MARDPKWLSDKEWQKQRKDVRAAKTAKLIAAHQKVKELEAAEHIRTVEDRPENELERIRRRYAKEFPGPAEDESPLKWTNTFRAHCEARLYVFAKYVLGMEDLDPVLHGGVCDWLQDMDPDRKHQMTPQLTVCGGRWKLLMLPVVHLKCLSRSFFEQAQRRLHCGLDTDTGEIRPTRFAAETGPQRPIYRIRTVSGREMDVTSNHPFLCWGPKWKSIDDGLVAGEWIAVVGRGQFGLDHNPDLARLVGWMIGDASLPRQSVTIWDEALQQEFIALAARCGFEAHIQESDIHNVNVLGMRPLWRAWGLLEAKSANKFIPNWILTGDRETVVEFLRGYFEADGTQLSGYQTRPVISFTTISRQLSLDVQHLLVKFGFQARRFENENNDGRHKWMPVGYRWYTITFSDTEGIILETPLPKGKVSRSSWMMPPEWRSVLVFGAAYQLRKEGIRFDVDTRYKGGGATSRDKLHRIASALKDEFLKKWCDSDVAWEPIRSVEYIGDEETVSIETGTHTLCEGDIISHNTSIGSHAFPLHALIQPTVANIYFPRMSGSDTRILLHGETAAKAKENLGFIRQHLEHNVVLRWLWPHLMWKEKKESPLWSDEAITVKRTGAKILAEPTITAIGVGTGLEQRHYDIVIMDDLATFEAAQSELVMERARARRKACRSRLNDLVTSIELGIGTHWTPLDIYTDWRKDPDVEVCIRSAIENEQPIWPNRHPLKKLLALQAEEGMGKVLFSANYMNNPLNSAFTALDWQEVRMFDYDPEGQTLTFEETEVDAILYQRNNLAGLVNANQYALYKKPLRGVSIDQLYSRLRDREEESPQVVHERRIARMKRAEAAEEEGSATRVRLEQLRLRKEEEWKNHDESQSR